MIFKTRIRWNKIFNRKAERQETTRGQPGATAANPNAPPDQMFAAKDTGGGIPKIIYINPSDNSKDDSEMPSQPDYLSSLKPCVEFFCSEPAGSGRTKTKVDSTEKPSGGTGFLC